MEAGSVLPAQSASTPRSAQVAATTRARPLTFTIEVLKKRGELPAPQRVGLGHPTAALPSWSHGGGCWERGSEPQSFRSGNGEGKEVGHEEAGEGEGAPQRVRGEGLTFRTWAERSCGKRTCGSRGKGCKKPGRSSGERAAQRLTGRATARTKFKLPQADE